MFLFGYSAESYDSTISLFVIVCYRAVAKNQRALQCDLCDSWVHTACKNLNVYTYWKLQKDKSPWYCICYFWKELTCGSTKDTQLKKSLHGEVVISPNPKIISSIIKQSEYLDEQLFSEANNKFYTPNEFNNALKNLNMASQFFLCTLIYPLFLIIILNYII